MMPRTLQGIFLAVLAYTLFSAGDIGRKWILEQGVNPPLVQFWASLGGVTGLLIAAGFRRELRTLARPRQIRLHALRTLCIMLILFMVVYGLKHIPLVEWYVLIFVSPFFQALFGRFFFGEHLHPARLLAVLAGFAGVLVVLRPGTPEWEPVLVLPLLLAVLFAIVNVIAKGFEPNVPKISFGLYPHIVIAPVFGLAAWDDFGLLPPPEMVVALLSGLCASLALIALGQGFRLAPAASVAPMHYTQLIWGSLFGWLIFRDVPDPMTWAGAVLIIGAGAGLVWFEHHKTSKA